MTAGAFFAAWWLAGMTGVWMWLFGMFTQRTLGPSWQVLTDFREGRRRIEGALPTDRGTR